MSTPAEKVHVRPGRPGELELARDIDDDATDAYVAVGIEVWLPHEHPFAQDEEARWRAALAEGLLLFACGEDGTPLGFAAFGLVDGRPYLHQISVRGSAARKGVGALLMEHVKRWAEPRGELWLTTYGHVSWNRPWYERLGFVCVDPVLAGPGMQAIMEKERAALPVAEERVLMRYQHPRSSGAA